MEETVKGNSEGEKREGGKGGGRAREGWKCRESTVERRTRARQLCGH